ncbi:MAG: DUF2691 family protein [Clostridia bacterium]|nr:DUF2691 family protein [Clostridia bacterium]
MNYIEIEAENKSGNILRELLKDAKIQDYYYKIGFNNEIHVDLYNSKNDCPLFEYNIIEGDELKEIVDNEKLQYYMIFLDLFAFKKREEISEIKNLEQLKESKCEFFLMCWDVSYFLIGVQDEEILQIIKNNCKEINYKFEEIPESRALEMIDLY